MVQYDHNDHILVIILVIIYPYIHSGQQMEAKGKKTGTLLLFEILSRRQRILVAATQVTAAQQCEPALHQNTNPLLLLFILINRQRENRLARHLEVCHVELFCVLQVFFNIQQYFITHKI